MLTLLLSSALAAAPFDGCEVQVVGTNEVVLCDGSVAMSQELPSQPDSNGVLLGFVGGVQASSGAAPTEPTTLDKADLAVTWKGQLGGQAATTVAGLKDSDKKTRVAACSSIDLVPGNAERCKTIATALLTTGIPAELPRSKAEMPKVSLTDALGRAEVGAKGCKEDSNPIASVSMCPDGVVTASVSAEGTDGFTADKVFPGLITSMTEAGFTFTEPKTSPCAITGVKTTCTTAIGTQGNLTLQAIAAERPFDGGTFVVSCGVQGDVAKAACATLLTTWPTD